MSSATASAVSPATTIFSGNLDTKESVEAFVNQIKYIIPFAETTGIKLEVNETDKVINSYLMNKNLGVVVYTTSKTIYDKFELPSGLQIGLLKLSDFTSMFNIFGSKGIALKFIDNEFKISDMTDEESVLSFKTADCALLSDSNKSFKGSNFFTDITIDDRFEALSRAMATLSNEDIVVISGSASKNKVTFKIVNGNMSVNNFKVTMDAKVSSDFEVPHRKDVFQNLIKIPIASKVLSIAERVIKVEATSPTLDMTVYLAKKANK